MYDQPLAAMAAAYGVRKIKQYANRRKLKLRGRRSHRQANRGSQFPAAGGRRMIKVPYNLPSKLKKGLKHCSTLTKKKIELFKDALMKTANQIYYYRGVYKAIELGKADNTIVQLLADPKTHIEVTMYGGGLGFGRVEPNYSTGAATTESYDLVEGNCLALCLDMPTGDFLPQRFIGDSNNGTGSYRRNFGKNADSVQWNQKKTTGLNTAERTDQDNLLVPANIIQTASTNNQLTWQKVYTLSYRYTLTFKANNCQRMTAWAITFKLGSSKPEDFSQGLSNYVNYQIKQDRAGVHKRLLRGEMPPCFKVLKKKRVNLIDQVSNNNAYMTNYGAVTKQGVIHLKSKKSYVSMGERPANQFTNTTAEQPDGQWYNENVHKYTYLFVYAVPTFLADYQATTTASGDQAPANRVTCFIEKETSFTAIAR